MTSTMTSLMTSFSTMTSLMTSTMTSLMTTRGVGVGIGVGCSVAGTSVGLGVSAPSREGSPLPETHTNPTTAAPTTSTAAKAIHFQFLRKGFRSFTCLSASCCTVTTTPPHQKEGLSSPLDLVSPLPLPADLPPCPLSLFRWLLFRAFFRRRSG